MKEYTITLKIAVPDDIPAQEVAKWAQYITHYSGSLSNDNPLVDEDLEPIGFDIR